jgi:predicted Fe-S protein YdhL (DUF1289 family)
MCVTIDEEIHQWLSKKPGKKSGVVNAILQAKMIAEMKQKAKRLPVKYCSKCDKHYETIRDECALHWCATPLVLVE